MYHGLAREQADPREWGADLVSAVEARMRSAVPAQALPERRRWRDRFLARIVDAKRAIRKELGA